MEISQLRNGWYNSAKDVGRTVSQISLSTPKADNQEESAEEIRR
jgi:hypothetical protein